MAGNHQLNEKMAVYNSVDQATEDRGKKEMTREDMELNIPRGSLKLKAVDPMPKKKSFEITGVVVAKVAIDHGNEECDSLDDVDETCETHTEDVSSDILDLSKNTDIEPDPSSTEDVSPNLEEPPRDPNRNISDMTSRFKVVKIETREPFKRGRWTCLDFLDPPAEKLDKGVEEAGSGNSSAASSIHYIPGIDDPGKNPFAANVVYAEGHTIHEPQAVLPSVSQAINILQNGDYTPSSMVMTSQSGVITIPESSSNTPPQVPDAAQSQPASLAKPLSSQPQPILTPSQPSSLPATLLSSQQPGKDYVQNAFPVNDSTKTTSQTTNGHIPAQASSTQNVAAPESLPTTHIPGSNKVNVPQTSSTKEIKNPTDYVVSKGQDYVQPTNQDFLPPGQDYGKDYLASGSDFLPPSSTEYTQATVPDAVSKPEPQAVIKQPPQNVQSDFAGTNQSHSSASSVPKSIAPSSTAKVGEFSSQATSVPAIVSQPTGSTTASPSNENVQNAEGLPPSSEKVPFKVAEDPVPPPKAVETVPVDNEEEPKVVSVPPSEKNPLTPTQSILTPPLLEMVATINAGAMDHTKSDGGERYVVSHGTKPVIFDPVMLGVWMLIFFWLCDVKIEL